MGGRTRGPMKFRFSARSIASPPAERLLTRRPFRAEPRVTKFPGSNAWHWRVSAEADPW